MDTRTFLLGAICGATIVGAINWKASLDDETRPAADVSPNQMSVAPIGGKLSRATAETNFHSSTSDPTLQQPFDDAQDRSNKAVEAPKKKSERDAELLSNFQSEPKDISWAYFSELAIGQFLADHPVASKFEVSYIDCRTTKCQIKAIGYDESTGADWQRLMYDMHQQPWSDFGQHGNYASLEDGRRVIVETMHRKQGVH